MPAGDLVLSRAPACSAVLEEPATGQNLCPSQNWPLGVGVRVVDYRFGVSLILLPKLAVYSILSPLEESISFPEWGRGQGTGLRGAGKGRQK